MGGRTQAAGIVLVALALVGAACTSDEPGSLATLSVVDTRITALGAGASEPVEAESGHELDVGDHLETDQTGYGELDYVDGSQTRLGPATSFTVVDLAAGDTTQVRTKLDVGRTWNSVKELGEGDRFEVETNVAVAAVRGTLFAVVCSALGCDFVVLEGIVVVVLPDGTEIELGPGDAVHVGPDGTVGDVLSMDRFLLLPGEVTGGSGAGGGTGGGTDGGTATDGAAATDGGAGTDGDGTAGGGTTGGDGTTTGGGTTGGATTGGATTAGPDGELVGSAAGGGDEAFARTTIAWIGRNLERDAETDRVTVLRGDVLLRLLRVGVDRSVLEPFAGPGGMPTEEPTAEPTEEPTQEPTEEPTQEPTEEPTASGGGTTGGTTTGGVTDGLTTGGLTDGLTTGGVTDGSTTGDTPGILNAGPVAGPDAATAESGTTVTVAVLANDTDPDGDSITLIGATADVGTAVANVDGSVSYTSPTGFTGLATVTYTIRDARGATGTGTLTVTVTAPVVSNTAPVAVADAAATTASTPVTIDVLANDTDADGDTLTVASVATPTSGTATIDAGGTVTYSPGPFTGTATFTYTASDGQGGTASATVTVTVAPPPNTPPVAIADTAATTSGTPVTVNVLANDTDADGDTLTVASVGTPNNGTALANTDGTVTYTSTAPFVGTATFTYTVSDGKGGTASAAVTVTVTAPNTAPVALPEAAVVTAGSSVDIDVLANDTDADGDTLSISAIGTPTAGTAALNTAGTITYTAPSTASGTATFSYTASDGRGGTDTALVSVTINAVNQVPTPSSDLAWTEQDSTITVDVLANDTDPDGDTLTLQSVSTPANGTASIVGGRVEYVPSGVFVGNDVVTYTVSDGTDTATTSLTVELVALSSLPEVGWHSDRTAPAGYLDFNAGTSDVYTMRPDGTNVVKWTDYTASGFHTSALAWARDGQQFSFTGTGTRQVFVADASTTPPADNSGTYPATTALNSGVPNSADTSTWSPDGSTVAFNYPEDPLGTFDWEIYTAASTGGSLTAVTAIDATHEGKPSWSPDGDRIVATSGGGLGFVSTFVEVAAPGNSLGQPVGTVLATHTLPVSGNSPVYTADGTGIVYYDSNGDLKLLDRATSTVTTVLADGRYNTSPDVSPDGRWIVYVSETTSTADDWDLYAIPLVENATPTPVALTTDGATSRDLSPAWRPGSANTAPTVANESVYMMDTSTIYVDVLANDSDPDGDPLSITSVTAAFGMASVTTTPEFGTTPVVAFTPALGFFGTTGISYTVADGNGGTSTGSVTVEVVDRSTMGQLAFSARPSTAMELRLANVDGTGLTPITTLEQGGFIEADWSPAGDQLLAGSSGTTRRLDVNGTILTAYPGDHGGHARWSPDGTAFVVSRFVSPGSTSHEIWTSNLDGSVLTPVLTTGFSHDPDWSPDGTRLAVEQAGELREIDLTGNPIQTLTASGASDMSYAPTGGRIAYAWMTDGGIRVVDTTTGAIQNVFSNSTSTMENTTWSPDERWVAFTMDAGSSLADIWVASVQPNAVNAAMVIDTGARDEYPAWRP